jgi:hypothetical protein
VEGVVSNDHPYSHKVGLLDDFDRSAWRCLTRSTDLAKLVMKDTDHYLVAKTFIMKGMLQDSYLDD